MDINSQMEQFSIGYIKALIAAAGFKYSIESVDDDSVDLTIIGKGFKGLLRNPKIDVQVKSTYANSISGNVLKYSLKKKNYDDLRGEDLTSPRYLLVVKLPSQNPIDWLKCGKDFVSLHNFCYWQSLRFEPDSDNTAKVTVDIPANQILTPASLKTLMNNASNRVHI